MAKKVKKGNVNCWVDRNGNEVPVEYIDTHLKKKERFLERVIKDAKKAETVIKSQKEKMVKQITDYLESVASSYGEHWKGNTQIISFSQEMKVEVNVSEHIEFDERLQVAKSKIDKCIESWSVGSDNKIATLVKSAFKVDKKGKVNTKQILMLRQHQFKDAQWKEAMDIISEAINVVSSKAYYKFFEKTEDGEWKVIELNFSKI